MHPRSWQCYLDIYVFPSSMEPSFKKEGTMHSPKKGKIPSAGIVG